MIWHMDKLWQMHLEACILWWDLPLGCKKYLVGDAYVALTGTINIVLVMNRSTDSLKEEKEIWVLPFLLTVLQKNIKHIKPTKLTCYRSPGYLCCHNKCAPLLYILLHLHRPHQSQTSDLKFGLSLPTDLQAQSTALCHVFQSASKWQWQPQICFHILW